MNELEVKRRASDLLQEGRYDEAIAEYQSLLDNSKRRHPAILNLLGDIYVKKGDYEQGFSYFLRASKLYCDEGLFHNGIAVAKKILRIDKDQIEVYGALGVLYARQGLGIDCIKYLNEYARLKTETGETSASLAAFGEACEILSDSPELAIAHAEMLVSSALPNEAAASYERAAELYAERGLEAFALEMRTTAASLVPGGGPPPAEDEPRDVNDLMSLRLMDDELSLGGPAAAERTAAESNAGPDDSGPVDSGGPASSTGAVDGTAAGPAGAMSGVHGFPPPSLENLQAGGDPLPVYDPSRHPDLPPPPPLPGAPSVRTVPVAGAPPAPVDSTVMPNALSFRRRDDEKDESLLALPGIILPPSMGVESSSVGPAERLSEPTDELPPVELPPVEPPRIEFSPAEPAAEFPPVEASPVEPEPEPEIAPEIEPGVRDPFDTGPTVVIGDDAQLVRDGGEVGAVIADFQRATSQLLDPDDAQAHFDLGTTFLEMELFEEASTEFEAASRSARLALPSREMLGYCYLRQGKLGMAVDELKKGLAIPGRAESEKLGLMYNLGIACGVMDREEEAIAYFQRILEVEPGFRDTGKRLERLVQER